MSQELKVCPYCGAKAMMSTTVRPDKWRIHCTYCSAEMTGWREEDPIHQHMDQKDALIIEWNRRQNAI